MRLTPLLLVPFLLLLTGCFEPDPPPRIATVSDCRCNPEIQDPLEEPLRFEFGKFAGQCVDSCRFRRARSVDEARALKLKVPKADEQHLMIGNFLHDDQYWIARVPVEDVESVNVLFEHFFFGISHVSLRFHFKGGGITLYPQNPSQKKAPPPVHDLLLSAEGVPARGVHYDMIDSALGRYTIAYRIFSAEQKREGLAKSHFITDQYKLKLSGEKMRRLLVKGLMTSEKRSFASTYQLIFNNCATAALDLLEPIVTGRAPQEHDPLHFDRGWTTDVANGTIRSLRDLGLILDGDGSRLKEFSSEISPR